jgi:hypothetical protein
MLSRFYTTIKSAKPDLLHTKNSKKKIVIMQMLKTRSQLTELKTRKTEIEVNREREITSLEGDMTEKASEKNVTEFFFLTVSPLKQNFFSTSVNNYSSHFVIFNFYFFEVFYKLQHIYFLIVVKK